MSKMKTYKINGNYILAKSPVDAVKAMKSFTKDAVKSQSEYDGEFKDLWRIGNDREIRRFAKEIVMEHEDDDDYREWVKAYERFMNVKYRKSRIDSVNDSALDIEFDYHDEGKREKAAAKSLGLKWKETDLGEATLTGSVDALMKFIKKMNYPDGMRYNIHDAVKDSVKDAIEDVDYDALIADEEEAIAGYEREMAKTDDEDILTVLRHIVEEEREHIAELEALRGAEKE